MLAYIDQGVENFPPLDSLKSILKAFCKLDQAKTDLKKENRLKRVKIESYLLAVKKTF